MLSSSARQAVVPGIFILASIIHAGCSSDSGGVHYASSNDPQPTATATPMSTPNPDQAAGLVTRFYRDADTETNDSLKDMFTIVSPDFVRSHHDDIIADYGWIKDPKVQIRSISGRTVRYALDYIYLTKAGKLFWERTGRWTLNHGSQSGWILDCDTWDSIHLVGITTPYHPNMIPVQDTVYADGRHEFSFDGQRYSFLAKGDDWHITALAAPTPTPNYADPQTDDSRTAGDSTTDPDATDTTVATVQTHFAEPSTAQAKCPNDIVVWVNTRSGVFHMPGTRWYGLTEYGTFECETDAFAEGDRESRNGQ